MTIEDLSPLAAESMSMSIWLRSDGLAFSISSLGEGSVLLRGELPLSRVYPEWEQAVEELFYEQEWLCYPYQRVYLYYMPRHSVLVPLELYDASYGEPWLTGVATVEDGRVLAEVLPLEGKVVLTSLSGRLMSFLERVHPPLVSRPYYLPIIEEQGLVARQGGRRTFVVVLQGRQLDCLVLGASGLLALNHYAICSEAGVRSGSEMMYYVLSLWQALSLDYVEDVLLFLTEGEGRELEELEQRLGEYIKHIEIAPLSGIKQLNELCAS